MLFYPAISKKFNRKPLMNAMVVISAVGYALMILSRIIPGIGFLLLTVGYMISNFGLYSYYLIMMISIINTVEYNEYKTGDRNEAIIASVRPLITKMSSALIVVMTTATYMIFGVTNYTNQISELENASAAGLISDVEKLDAIKNVLSGVDPSQTWGLLILMVVVPYSMMIISNALYQKKYTLDEAEYARICKELEARAITGGGYEYSK